MDKEKAKLRIIMNFVGIFVVMMYGAGLTLGYTYIENLSQYTEILSMALLLIGIVIFEIAYKKDESIIWVHGLEVTILAVLTLLLWHIMETFNLSFNKQIIIISAVFIIYYVLKNIFVITNERRKYLNSLSDIKDIVKKDVPQKKKATKRRK